MERDCRRPRPASKRCTARSRRRSATARRRSLREDVIGKGAHIVQAPRIVTSAALARRGAATARSARLPHAASRPRVDCVAWTRGYRTLTRVEWRSGSSHRAAHPVLSRSSSTVGGTVAQDFGRRDGVRASQTRSARRARRARHAAGTRLREAASQMIEVADLTGRCLPTVGLARHDATKRRQLRPMACAFAMLAIGKGLACTAACCRTRPVPRFSDYAPRDPHGCADAAAHVFCSARFDRPCR